MMNTTVGTLVALALLVPVTAVAQQSPYCDYDPSSGDLTIDLTASSGNARLGYLDDGTIVASSGCPAEATLTTVDTIFVIGGSTDLALSMTGVFAPGRTLEADGSSEIEIFIALGAGVDKVLMKPTRGDDVVTFSADGLDVGGDLDEDVTITQVESIRVSGWDGSDVVDASRYRGTAVLSLHGGNDDDLLIGSPAGDSMYGNNQAGSGFEADEIRGMGGDDLIDGGNGDDALYGGPGNDTFHEGAESNGSDTIRGGSGIDTVSYSDRTISVTVTLDGIRDDGAPGENDLIETSIEAVNGGPAADILVGSDAANTLNGGGGDDELYGGAGDDVLRGGGGNDFLVGDGGTDAFFGGLGNDIFINDDGVAETVNCGLGTADDPEPSPDDTFRGCELI